MSRHYKQINNGKGTDLIISDEAYISVGEKGNDVTIRGDGKVIAFDKWEDFVNAIDVTMSNYYMHD